MLKEFNDYLTDKIGQPYLVGQHSMITELIKAAQAEVENHSIYVWGGSGQLCCEVTHTVQKDEQGNIVLVPVEAQE